MRLRDEFRRQVTARGSVRSFVHSFIHSRRSRDADEIVLHARDSDSVPSGLRLVQLQRSIAIDATARVSTSAFSRASLFPSLSASPAVFGFAHLPHLLLLPDGIVDHNTGIICIFDENIFRRSHTLWKARWTPLARATTRSSPRDVVTVFVPFPAATWPSRRTAEGAMIAAAPRGAQSRCASRCR